MRESRASVNLWVDGTVGQTESVKPDPKLPGSTFDSELFQLDDMEGPQRR